MPNNEYGNMTGTSMSAGYVTGAAALAVATGTPVAELKDTLKSSANKVSTLENIVDDNNLVDFTNVVYAIVPQEEIYVSAEDDFDRWKEKTPEENWELFNASTNIDVSTGHNYYLVLKKDGTVWAWGRNFAGQLGNGDYLPSATPNLVIGLDNIKEISIGDVHCLALDKNGTIWAWGNNSYSPFGDKYPSNPRIPVNLDYTDLQNVKDISAGSYYSLFLKEDGTVWGMGDGTNGVLGFSKYVGKPKEIEYLSNIKSISAGDTYAMALREDGMVYSWGDNSSGQLGNGTTTKSDTPSRMQNISNVKSISAKSTHSLALKEDGTVWAWGSNIYGQLGNGTTEDKLVPVQVIGLNSTHNIKSIVQIPYGSCAIGEDGNVWYWGKNIKPLGEGTTENILTPVRSESFTDIESFFEMDEHALILKKDETILTWGYNIDGQLGDSRTICREIPHQLPACKLFFHNRRSIAENIIWNRFHGLWRVLYCVRSSGRLFPCFRFCL